METPVSQLRPDYDSLAPRVPEGPIDLRKLVPGGEGPVELDIGFGRGRSLFERAQTAPEARIIGIEVKPKWAHKVAERTARAGLARVQVFAGDAREILARSGPPGCVARVLIQFPDPWWKKRHLKRRIFDRELLDTLGSLLAPRGELLVQTDVEERAYEHVATLQEHSAFELAGQNGFVDHNVFGARSNREVRAEQDGLPIWRVLAHRK